MHSSSPYIWFYLRFISNLRDFKNLFTVYFLSPFFFQSSLLLLCVLVPWWCYLYRHIPTFFYFVFFSFCPRASSCVAAVAVLLSESVVYFVRSSSMCHGPLYFIYYYLFIFWFCLLAVTMFIDKIIPPFNFLAGA